MAHVLIVGGGFGGLAAAHELRSAYPALEVTLVARDDRFYMGFAKLWDLGRTRPLEEGTRSLSALTERGVNFVQDDVIGLMPWSCSAATTKNGTITADAMLIGVGAATSPAHLDLLAADAAHDLYDGRSLPAIHEAIEGLDGGRILVSILGGPFKCPPAPFEAALTLDSRLRAEGRRDAFEIVVTTPQFDALPVAGPDASAYVASHLAEYGIELRTSAAVIDIDGAAHTVTFANETTEHYDLLLGVPASVPPPVLADSGLAGASGWIEPDPLTLRTSFDYVYAVGDCTHVPNAIGALPKAGVFAAAQGRIAAGQIAAELGYGKQLPGTDIAAELDGPGLQREYRPQVTSTYDEPDFGAPIARPGESTGAPTFDGHGFCFLELPGERVAFVEGDFFAHPRPIVTLSEADHEQWERKVAYEREHLDLWLG